MEKSMKKKFGGYGRSDPAKDLAKAIKFYDQDETHIYVPYIFASSLLKQLPHEYKRYPSAAIRFTGSLLPHQVEVEAELRRELWARRAVTLVLPPGSGKTVYGAYEMAMIGLITCILLPDVDKCNQWLNTLVKFTDAKAWVIGSEVTPAEANVFICPWTRVDQIPEAHRKAVGLLIVDEVHMFCTKERSRTMLKFHPKFIITESATPIRDDGQHLILEAMAGKAIVRRHNEKPFLVVQLMTGFTPTMEKRRNGIIDYDKRLKSLIYSDYRNQLIINIVTANPKDKPLILVDQTAHADHLEMCMLRLGISCAKLVGSKRTYHDASVIIGTAAKIGTGFDEATMCADFRGVRVDLLILCISTKKEARLEQNVGRVFRSSFPRVIHFVDNDYISERHWKISEKWYKREAGIVIPNMMPGAGTGHAGDSGSSSSAHVLPGPETVYG